MTLPSTESSTIPADSLSSISTSVHDTWDPLVTLNDGIPPLILKYAATALVDPIHCLFNLCISQSYLSSEWCSHLITPVPKTGDRSNIENYQPISLLCSISKVLEKIIFDKVSDFISLSQFGFIKNQSTVQKLLLYCDLLSNALHKHHQVDPVYLDIRKAFVTVPHDILLSKLWNAGITGSLWNFFKAYLNNRKNVLS